MLKIELLRAEDISAARRLSDQVGWNHMDADWGRLIGLWPDSCLAGWLEGELIATATLASFAGAERAQEHLAWVGVMLVDVAHRGAGHGGKMFDAVLKIGEERGVTNFGLDATDMGRPLYAKRGFLDVVTMHRWKCAAPLGERDLPRGVRRMEARDWVGVKAVDRAACGLDRGRLLERIAGEAGVRVLVAEEDGVITGVGILRLGRVAAYAGPVVGKDAATGAALFKALMGCHADSGTPVFVDTVTRPALEPALTEEGFEIARTLTRMGRGWVGHRMAYGERVFAIAGLELC